MLIAGAAGLLALATYTPAKADTYVDPPSFGRIVYGITGGTVVLPQDAWTGAYPDGSGTIANPNDAAFGGGAILVGTKKQYAGDNFGAPGTNTGISWSTVSGGVTSVAKNLSGVFSSGTGAAHDMVVSTKLGFVASYGWESQIGVYGANGGALPASVATLFGAHTGATTGASTLVDDPFAFEYSCTGVPNVAPAFSYYSDNAANNSGFPQNKLYSHFLAYQVTDPTNINWYGHWFVGFEDTNFNVTNNYHRFDYNDNVIDMTFEAIPEPAFFQMAGLLGLGALGMFRARRRSAAK